MARKEIFSRGPLAASVPSSGKPRLSMVDRQIIALRMERERQQAAIMTREELFADMTDFSYLDPVDEYGFPKITPYQIPDSIPDVLPLPEKELPKVEPEPKKEDLTPSDNP